MFFPWVLTMTFELLDVVTQFIFDCFAIWALTYFLMSEMRKSSAWLMIAVFASYTFIFRQILTDPIDIHVCMTIALILCGLTAIATAIVSGRFRKTKKTNDPIDCWHCDECGSKYSNGYPYCRDCGETKRHKCFNLVERCVQTVIVPYWDDPRFNHQKS